MPFTKLGLYSSIVRAVQAKGYGEPTPIQQQAIPAVLTRRDLIASAQTGTGKTAAFALPILNRLGPHSATGPRVLVLEPTRELAAQVDEAFREFGQFTDLRTALVHGGVGFGKQRAALRKGSDIVVATVGRLLDLLRERALTLDHLQVLVLDEVDRMLDMGFIEGVKTIVSLCPHKRQTLFFSATLPAQIEEVARFALRDPQRIAIGRARSVTESVTHAMYPVSQGLKFQLLLALLEKTDFESVIVFTRTKHGADKIAAQLKEAGHSVTLLHGNRSQGQRRDSLAGFKEGRYEVLVATDIAARGIDIEGVSHVINYDIPLSPDDYVHRIGRTGRAAAEGDAFTLFTPRERDEVKAIERFIRADIPQLKLKGFDYRATPAEPVREHAHHPRKQAGATAERTRGPQSGAAPREKRPEKKRHEQSKSASQSQPAGRPHPKGKPGAHWMAKHPAGSAPRKPGSPRGRR